MENYQRPPRQFYIFLIIFILVFTIFNVEKKTPNTKSDYSPTSKNSTLARQWAEVAYCRNSKFGNVPPLKKGGRGDLGGFRNSKLKKDTLNPPENWEGNSFFFEGDTHWTWSEPIPNSVRLESKSYSNCEGNAPLPHATAVESINGDGIIFSYEDYTVWVIERGRIIQSYPASGAALGLGEQIHSEQTPRGLHTVYRVIGGDRHPHTRYIGRKPVGQVRIYYTQDEDPGLSIVENFVLTGIIWLIGPKTLKNRYIYFHATNRLWAVGHQHISHGCILLSSENLLDLMHRITLGTKVYIY